MNKKIKIIVKTLSVIAIAAVFMLAAYVENLQTGVADSVLRLHIVAESNSVSDQLIKLCVRDRILSDFSDMFENCGSADAAAELAKMHLSDIEKSVNNELARFNKSGAAAKIEKCVFPTKNYGSLTFPAGEYTALNIKIGAAEGRNWWCVMYPPLCITDSAVDKSIGKLKENLTEEEYRLITEKDLDIKIKFKIAEIFFGKE